MGFHSKLVMLAGFFAVSLSPFQILHANPSPIDQPELRVATGYKIHPERLEPASYGEASEYDYVSYLYSPLIEFDNNGQLVSGLASKFYWQGSDLVFELRQSAKSSKGNTIEAEDVVVSLKRLHILRPRHATQFFDEVCQGKPITSLKDSCPGLVADGKKLTVRFKTRKPVYLDLLTGVDFAVVPRTAVDMKTSKLKDYSDGTGPYKLTEMNEKDSFFRLEARKDHWLWKESMPQKVLIKTYMVDGHLPHAGELADGYFSKEFDLLPTYANARSLAGFVLEKKYKSLDVFVSNPISTYILFFSDRAKKEYSAEERIAIGEIYREAFYREGKIEFDNQYLPSRKSRQFFPPNSDGSLTGDQEKILDKAVSKARDVKFRRTPELHVIKSYMQDVIAYIDATKGKLAYKNDESYTVPPNKDFNNRFDGFFALINTSSVESADSLFSIKSLNWMPYTEAENDKWIAKYLEVEDKSERVKLMRDLHLDMLTKGILAPIKALPYAAVVRKPWRLKFSPLFSSTPLWNIEYSPKSY
jgi:hypothetical protein